MPLTDVCVHIGVNKQQLQTTDVKKERAANDTEPLMNESRISCGLFDQGPFSCTQTHTDLPDAQGQGIGSLTQP